MFDWNKSDSKHCWGLFTFTSIANSEIFARILFSRIALKDISCDVKNSRQMHDLPISVNDSDLAISRGFANIKPSRIYSASLPIIRTTDNSE